MKQQFSSIMKTYSMDRTSEDDLEAKHATPMQEINEAFKECGFGFFHYKLLFTSLFAVLSAMFISNTTPYLLPNAECDLNMNLLQKGILNGVPYVGMILSSIIAGFLTDTFGRKRFMIGGHAGIFLLTLVSSLSQTYAWLLTAKLFEGILFAAAFSPALTFTSEFCHSGIRDRVMLFQSSYQALGQVLLACLSWGILMQDWKTYFFDGYFVLNTWNFYLMILSSFSLTASILYYFQPESPKFLLNQHRYDEARDVLIRIWKQNTGKPVDTFPLKDLWKDKSKKMKDDCIRMKTVPSTLSHQIVSGLHNVKPMFLKPLGPYLALFCTINFLLMVLYNVIRLWFPQLSTIVEHYSKAVGSNQDLCVMLDTYTSDLNARILNTTAADMLATCVPTKSGSETYINSIILGCVCMFPFVLSGVLVNKVGKKYLLMFAGVISIGVTLGLRWASSKTEVVALFATDLAVSQSMISLLQATAIEVFPTSSRTLAISMIMTCGRIGTLVGNIMFPILLNMGCVVPFFTLAGVMIGVVMISVFLPKKKK